MKILVRRWSGWRCPVEVLLVLSEKEALWLNAPDVQFYHLKWRTLGSEVTEWDGEEWK